MVILFVIITINFVTSNITEISDAGSLQNIVICGVR